MKDLVIVTPFFGTSGYSQHGRNLANALSEFYSVRVETQLPAGWETTVSDVELRMIKKPRAKDETMIYIGQPPYWRFGLNDNPKKFIGVLVWEGDAIPSYWLEYLLDPRVDQVWCPSEHVKYAIQKAAMPVEDGIEEPDMEWVELTEKIRIIPHGFNKEDFFKEEVPREKDFTFLVNKGWVNQYEDRGGVQYVVKAFSEEFSEEEPARLVVKLNPAYADPTPEWIATMMKPFVREKGGKIMVSKGYMSTKELRDLYNSSDVFVCATRAEAFNIPGLEAHACGLPTIQTGFGGQVSFMTEGTDWYIPFELEEVKNDSAYEGVKWALPNMDELRKQMRFCYENPFIVKFKGTHALTEVDDWTWREAAITADKALKEMI